MPSGGEDKKLFGMEPKTAAIVAAVVVVGGYLYLKSKQAQQPQGGGGGTGSRYRSPTGMSRQQFVIHVRDHSGHRHG